MSDNLPAKGSTTSLANPTQAAELFAEEANRTEGGSGNKAFLKLDGNTGEYSYGADNEELEPGTRVLLNIDSYARGWLCWLGGEVKEEIMVPILEGHPPKKHELPDHGPYEEDGDGWVEQMTIDMRLLEEPFTEMVFQANNASKRRAMGALMKDFSKRFQKHPGEVPVIEIEVAEFEAKMGKNSKRKVTKYAPSFKIVDWLTPEEIQDIFGAGGGEDDDDDGEDEPPKRKSRKSRDEDEDRPKRRSKAKARDEDDEDDDDDDGGDEEPPRRSRKKSKDADEDEDRPQRRSKSKPRDEDDDDDDDGQEEKKPRRRNRF